MRPIYNNCKLYLIQSKSFLEYESDAIEQLEEIKKKNKISKPINQPINIKCIYYRGDKRRCDLLNLLNATADILVDAGIIEDDNYNILVSADGSRVFYDKENPRTEIEIKEVL